jgi:predicted nuclease with TOPRIM domain
MNRLKNILSALSIILIIVLVYVFTRPEDTKELDDLHKQNDSLIAVITSNNLKLDSLERINNKLDSQRNVLKIELGKVDAKAKKLKEQHEKDIQHLNSLSNNDITQLFADKFTEIE